MMKQFILNIILLIVCSSNILLNSNFQNEIDSDKIIWSENRKLTWKDFQGPKRDFKSNKIAETSSNIKISYQFSKNKITDYKVEAAFSKIKSWTKSNKSDVLAHEQLHFDITELYARKIRKSFDSLIVKRKNTVANFKSIYQKNTQNWKRSQNTYDKEVYGNSVLQKKWISAIELELEKSEKYKIDSP